MSFLHQRKCLKVLICGGRNLDHSSVWNALERNCLDMIADKLDLEMLPKVVHVIHGGARGADDAAGSWAKSEGAKVTVYKANWHRHGKSAGPIRNQRMIDEGRPDVVVALPGGRGTQDMVNRATNSGIPVVELSVYNSVMQS